MLGYVIRDNVPLTSDPFYSDVLHAVEKACARRGMSIAYAHVSADATRATDLPPMIQHRHVQGLLVVGAFPPDFYSLIQRVGLPWVCIDYFDDSVPTDCITGRDVYGGYLATRHLLELGHRNPPPAMLFSPPDLQHGPYGPNFHLRWTGYCQALAEFGVAYDPSYVPRSETHLALQELLALPHPPTAIFCCNDPAALLTLTLLQERGIRVPQDCSVVGYDDIYLAARAGPPLTTVTVDRETLASEAVDAVLKRIAQPDLPARHILIAGSLVSRHSVLARQDALSSAPLKRVLRE